ncbi:MAG TPA: hypothetical protein VGH99_19570 [Pseudonocardia sp.]
MSPPGDHDADPRAGGPGARAGRRAAHGLAAGARVAAAVLG